MSLCSGQTCKQGFHLHTTWTENENKSSRQTMHDHHKTLTARFSHMQSIQRRCIGSDGESMQHLVVENVEHLYYVV